MSPAGQGVHVCDLSFTRARGGGALQAGSLGTLGFYVYDVCTPIQPHPVASSEAGVAAGPETLSQLLPWPWPGTGIGQVPPRARPLRQHSPVICQRICDGFLMTPPAEEKALGTCPAQPGGGGWHQRLPPRPNPTCAGGGYPRPGQQLLLLLLSSGAEGGVGKGLLPTSGSRSLEAWTNLPYLEPTGLGLSAPGAPQRRCDGRFSI